MSEAYICERNFIKSWKELGFKYKLSFFELKYCYSYWLFIWVDQCLFCFACWIQDLIIFFFLKIEFILNFKHIFPFKAWQLKKLIKTLTVMILWNYKGFKRFLFAQQMNKDFFRADLALVYITCPSTPTPKHTHTQISK